MSDRLRVTLRQTAMTRVTPKKVAAMSSEEEDALIVNINDECIRENSILSTRMGEIEGDVAKLAEGYDQHSGDSWDFSLSHPLPPSG